MEMSDIISTDRSFVNRNLLATLLDRDTLRIYTSIAVSTKP